MGNQNAQEEFAPASERVCSWGELATLPLLKGQKRSAQAIQCQGEC